MNSAPVEVNPKPTIGQIGVDALMLARRLAAVSVGEQISYKELSQVIGKDVQAGNTLRSARNHVLRDGIIFDCVRGVGLVRMTNDKKAESWIPDMHKARRACKRGMRKLLTVNMDELSPEKQRSVSVGMSTLGAIELFTSAKSIRKIEDSIKPSAIPQKVNVEELSKLFSK